MSHKDDIDKLFTSKLDSRNFEFNEQAWTQMESMLPPDVDNLFKNKLSDRNIAFNEASWKKMETLLDNSPSKFVIKPVYSIAAGLALLIAAGTGIYLGSNQSDSPSISETKQLENVTPNESITIDGKTTEQRISTSNSVQEKGIANYNDVASSTHGNENEASNDIQSTKKSDLFDNNSTLPNNNTSFNRKNSTTESGQQQNKGLINNIEDVINSSKEIDNEHLADVTSIESGENPFNESVVELPSLQKENAIELDNSLLDEFNENELVFLDSFELPKQERHYIGFMAGANFSQSFQSENSNGSSFGPNVFAGLSYKYILGTKLALNGNALYQYRDGINTEKQFGATSYSFGRTLDSTNVKANQLHYIEIPIYLDYLVGGQHSFLGGVSTSYLINSKSTVTKKQTTQFDSNVSSTTEYGHNEGFQRFDFALIAGYEYLLRPDLNIGLRMNYGLLDVTKNDYFKSDIANKNLQFRVYLKYNLFRL